MVGDTPPLSNEQPIQQRNIVVSGKEYKIFGDLKPEQVAGCGDIWEKLLGTIEGGKLDDDSTSALWDMVFEDGWSSKDSIDEPPTLPPGRKANLWFGAAYGSRTFLFR